MNQKIIDNPCLAVRGMFPFTFTGSACFHCGELPESRPQASQRKSTTSLTPCSECQSAFFCSDECERAARTPIGHLRDCSRLRSLDRAPSRAHHETATLLESTAQEEWMSKCKLLLIQAERTVEHPLHKSALMNYITYEAHCIVCNATRDQCELFPCPQCHLDHRCTEHVPRAKEEHTKDECQTFQLSAACALFTVKHIRNYKEWFVYVPNAPSGSDIQKNMPASGWSEYMLNRMGRDFMGSLPPELLVQSTYMTSQPLSTALGMRHFGISTAPPETLTVHVVGASISYEILPEHVWEEVMHLHPSVRTLNVIFIGPETSTHNMPLIDIGVCPGCAEDSRTRTTGIVQGTYEDYFHGKVEGAEFFKPDLVVMFNNGVHEHGQLGPWRNALDVMLEQRFPIFSTSYSLEEAELDAKLWTEIGAKVVRGPERNPYRCMVPSIDFITNDSVFYFNNYFMCIQGYDEAEA